MSSDHYFSETPDSEFKPKEISVEIDGRKVNVTTSGGIFSPDRIDQGTAVLLDHLDELAPSGEILDIGCGWGPISLAIATRSPKANVWAIDVNNRSLELTAKNAKSLGLGNVKTARPDEVPAGIEFAAIWSNPPIRVGKNELHQILLTWLPRLTIGGEAFLVVQKNLGSDSLQRWLEGEFTKTHSVLRLATAKGYRVLRIRRKL